WRGAAVGRHVASWFMRTRYLGSIDLDQHHDALAAEMSQSIAALRASSAVLDREEATCVLMTERGYTTFGAFFDAALTRARRVVQYIAPHRDDARIFKAYSLATRTQHPASLSAESWSEALSVPFGVPERSRLLSHIHE